MTTTTDVATNFTANDDDSYEALAALQTCGWLVLLLYVPLSLVVAWRTSLHFLYSNRSAKKVFHVTLLVSTLLQLPEAVEWIWYPLSQSWKDTYLCRLYSLLLLSLCKSYLAVCWAGVVSAGQRMAKRRISKLVAVLNSLLILWGVLVPISGAIVVLAYGVLLGYHGFRLRRRLLLARGTVPAASVEKSLKQLMLAIFIFVVSDVVRLLALLLNEFAVAMSMTVYLVLCNIIPNVFPIICMVYLMRRVTGRDDKDVETSHMKKLAQRTLSKYMTDPDSDGSSRGSTGGENPCTYEDNAIVRAQWELQVQQQYICHQQDQIQSDREAEQSPASCWVRESVEIR